MYQIWPRYANLTMLYESQTKAKLLAKCFWRPKFYSNKQWICFLEAEHFRCPALFKAIYLQLNDESGRKCNIGYIVKAAKHPSLNGTNINMIPLPCWAITVSSNNSRNERLVVSSACLFLSWKFVFVFHGYVPCNSLAKESIPMVYQFVSIYTHNIPKTQVSWF